MTDAAERAADAERAEMRNRDQQRAQEAMRAVFAAVLAEVDAELANERAREVEDLSGWFWRKIGRINALLWTRKHLLDHAAAAGLELE